MSATVISRHVRAFALGGLSLGFVSCYENEDGGNATIAALFDSVRRVSMRACACDEANPELEGLDTGCAERLERLDCVEPIVQKHGAELADWAECSLMAYREVEQCFERFGCDEDTLETCVEQADIEDVCGDIPDEIDDAVDEESGKVCLEDVYCSDGSMVRGNECNEITECQDGSDEQFCESEPLFNCDNGNEVPASWLCDGSDDCGDGSDEAQALCQSRR